MGKDDGFKIDGIQLLRAIANKNNDMKAAKEAFELFVGYFEQKISVLVEVQANKIGYNEYVALAAIQCAFNKVWLYPTFDMRKSNCKDEEKGIIVWLIAIAVSQMHQYTKNGVCAQIDKEDDLSVIEDSETFVNFNANDLEPEKKIFYVKALNQKMSLLDEKHRIIYLTYKAYHIKGKKLPRTVLEKLRKRLNLTQTTIRVYKKEACEALNDYNLLES